MLQVIHMRERKTTSRFAVALQAELRERGWGVRTLARNMVKTDADGWERHVQVESARRKLNNYLLLGVRPSDDSVAQIEDALGVDSGTLMAEETHMEEVELVAALLDQLDAVRSRMAARKKVPA